MHINTLFVYTTWTNHKLSKHIVTIVLSHVVFDKSEVGCRFHTHTHTHFFTYSPLVLRKWPFGALGDLWTVLAIQDIFGREPQPFVVVLPELKQIQRFHRPTVEGHISWRCLFSFFSVETDQISKFVDLCFGGGVWTGTKLLARFIISFNQSLGKWTTWYRGWCDVYFMASRAGPCLYIRIHKMYK